MRIGEWFRKSRSVQVNHGSFRPDSSESWEQAERAAKRKNRLFEMVIAAAITTPIALGYGYSEHRVSQYQQFSEGDSPYTQQQIEAHLGEQSRLLHGIIGDERITVIQQNDPNLPRLIANISIDSIPDTRHKNKPNGEDFSRDIQKALDEILLPLQGEENAIRTSALDYMSNNTSNAEVFPMDDGDHRICYMQLHQNRNVAPDGQAFDYDSSPDMEAFVAVHEITHCMDFGDTQREMEIEGKMITPFPSMQQEALADVVASLVIGSRTGNWDVVEANVYNMRNLHKTHTPVDDPHANKTLVKRTLDQINLEDHKNLTIHEAFTVAAEAYSKMDFEKAIYDLLDEVTVNKVRASIENGNDEFRSIDDQSRKFWKEKFGITTDEAMLDYMEDYSKGVYMDYIRNVVYNDFNSKDVADYALSWGNRIAEAYHDDDLKAALKSSEDNLSRGGGMDYMAISSSLGVDPSTLKTPGDRARNNQKIADIYNTVFPEKSLKSTIPSVVTPQVEGFDVENARQSFREKHRTYDGPTNHHG